MIFAWVLGALLALFAAEGVARVAIRRGGRYALVPYKRSEFQLAIAE